MNTDSQWSKQEGTCDSGVARCQSQHQWHTSNRTTVPTQVTIVIVATIVLLEINGGPEHRYSSRLSGSLLYLARWVQDQSVASKLFVLENNYSLCTICGPTYSLLLKKLAVQ